MGGEEHKNEGCRKLKKWAMYMGGISLCANRKGLKIVEIKLVELFRDD